MTRVLFFNTNTTWNMFFRSAFEWSMMKPMLHMVDDGKDNNNYDFISSGRIHSPVVAGVVHRRPPVLRINAVNVQAFWHQLCGEMMQPKSSGLVQEALARLIWVVLEWKKVNSPLEKGNSKAWRQTGLASLSFYGLIRILVHIQPCKDTLECRMERACYASNRIEGVLLFFQVLYVYSLAIDTCHPFNRCVQLWEKKCNEWTPGTLPCPRRMSALLRRKSTISMLCLAMARRSAVSPLKWNDRPCTDWKSNVVRLTVLREGNRWTFHE